MMGFFSTLCTVILAMTIYDFFKAGVKVYKEDRKKERIYNPRDRW